MSTITISMFPDVSVLLPCHNAENTLEEALQSICRQTLESFEVVAVDDGSTDSSADILGRLASRDPRFRLIRAGRVGLPGALNCGLQSCRGMFVARMDADDIMHENRLEAQYKFLQDHGEVDLVSCRVELFPRHALRNGYLEYERWQNSCVTETEIANNLFVESPFAHPSVMVRRRVLDVLGGYREGPFPEDYELWLRMAEAGSRMVKLPQVLLRWRESSDRLSRTDDRYSREAFDRLRAKYLGRDPRIRNAREIVLWGAGRTTRLRSRRLLDLGIRHSGWIDIDPRKIGRTIWGVQVHAPDWLVRDPRPFVLVYVTNHGAREEIAQMLTSMGYRPGHDFLAVG